MDLFPRDAGFEPKQPDKEVRRRPEAVPCDICGSPMQEHHCKLVCHSCGFMRDCSDP
ncbi:MAG: hypothetical protein HZB25_10550 [Candidatus Eisenbacteria bacterium]|nr:hypothetical protein [Candidatus Eisenbacteria bacterium]